MSEYITLESDNCDVDSITVGSDNCVITDSMLSTWLGDGVVIGTTTNRQRDCPYCTYISHIDTCSHYCVHCQTYHESIIGCKYKKLAFIQRGYLLKLKTDQQTQFLPVPDAFKPDDFNPDLTLNMEKPPPEYITELINIEEKLINAKIVDDMKRFEVLQF